MYAVSLSIVVFRTTTTQPLHFAKLHTALHKLLRDGQIIAIYDIVPALHRVCLVAADLHPYHLRYAITPHIANGGSAKIVEV
jgi:hypothetical protein